MKREKDEISILVEGMIKTQNAQLTWRLTDVYGGINISDIQYVITL